MRQVLAAIAFVAVLALSGCSSWNGPAGSPWHYCKVTMGYRVGSKEWADCVDADPEVQRGIQMDKANMQLGLAVLGGVLEGYAEAKSEGQGPNQLPIFKCPDGRFVSSGRCYRSPTGRYVGGPPRLAPDGTYVGGSGPIILCPDGTYVAGSRCYLAPDGSYVDG